MHSLLLIVRPEVTATVSRGWRGRRRGWEGVGEGIERVGGRRWDGPAQVSRSSWVGGWWRGEGKAGGVKAGRREGVVRCKGALGAGAGKARYGLGKALLRAVEGPRGPGPAGVRGSAAGEPPCALSAQASGVLCGGALGAGVLVDLGIVLTWFVKFRSEFLPALNLRFLPLFGFLLLFIIAKI